MALPVRRGDGQQVARWDPLAELNRLDEQLHQYLGNWARFPSLVGEAMGALADLEETDDAYIVEVELPGVTREAIDVEVSGRRLTVSGERKERERTGILRRSTRTVGRFGHEVLLPGEVDEEGVEATLDEGVLTVRVPRASGSDRSGSPSSENEARMGPVTHDRRPSSTLVVRRDTGPA